MIEAFAMVALMVDSPGYSLCAGDTGTIVDMVRDGEAHVVEFMTILGATVAVAEVTPTEIRPIEQGEIASARRIESAA
ncbi:MAG: DUF4926 domain-containing protein [Anaerolineae bacterium]|nr:DUF4926 domain-containing protein [Anaerolineae bacterium]